MLCPATAIRFIAIRLSPRRWVFPAPSCTASVLMAPRAGLFFPPPLNTNPSASGNSMCAFPSRSFLAKPSSPKSGSMRRDGVVPRQRQGAARYGGSTTGFAFLETDPIAEAEALIAAGRAADAARQLQARLAAGRGGLLARLTLVTALLEAGRDAERAGRSARSRRAPSRRGACRDDIGRGSAAGWCLARRHWGIPARIGSIPIWSRPVT